MSGVRSSWLIAAMNSMRRPLERLQSLVSLRELFGESALFESECNQSGHSLHEIDVAILVNVRRSAVEEEKAGDAITDKEWATDRGDESGVDEEADWMVRGLGDNIRLHVVVDHRVAVDLGCRNGGLPGVPPTNRDWVIGEVVRHPGGSDRMLIGFDHGILQAIER